MTIWFLHWYNSITSFQTIVMTVSTVFFWLFSSHHNDSVSNSNVFVFPNHYYDKLSLWHMMCPMCLSFQIIIMTMCPMCLSFQIIIRTIPIIIMTSCPMCLSLRIIIMTWVQGVCLSELLLWLCVQGVKEKRSGSHNSVWV